MIDALMYGMIPRAKIVTLDKAPPENISKKPMSAPPFSIRNLLNSSPLIPGVGIWEPILYTARRARVNNTLVFSSGILKIF